MSEWNIDPEVDVVTDRLDDAAERFRAQSRALVVQLSRLKDLYDAEILAATYWACKVGLIEEADWTDEVGEPFLPVAQLQVVMEPVPDVATMFRDRVALLRGGAHE